MWVWLPIILGLIPAFTLAAAIEPTDCASWNRISTDVKGMDQKGVVVAKHLKKALRVKEDSWPPPMDDPNVRMGYAVIMIFEVDNFCTEKRNSKATLDTAFTHAAAIIKEKGQKLAQQPTRTRPVLDPVYDPAYQGTTYSALGGPFLIKTGDSLFRKTGYYPWREIMADGMFLFIETNIFNNLDRPLRIPGFTLEDSRGRTYVTASRARLFRKIIWEGESLNPGVSKDGYLVFDVPWLSGFDPLPIRYKLLISNSRHTLDVNVYKKEE